MAVFKLNQNFDDDSENLNVYSSDEMHDTAKSFLESVVKPGLLQEHVNMYRDPSTFFNNRATATAMKKYFLEECFDPNDPQYKSAESIENYKESINTLFNNDMKAVLKESAPLGGFNPVIGMTFPIHKNLLMTTVFDKAIPKDVAAGPKFTLTMETRKMFLPDGTEIDLFLQQDRIRQGVESSIPRKDIIIDIPENRSVDVLGLMGAADKTTSNLSISTCVTKIIIDGVYVAAGDEYYDTTSGTIMVADSTTQGVHEAVLDIGKINFVSSYGQFDYTFNRSIDMILATDANGGTKQLYACLSGIMHKNQFIFQATDPSIKALVVSACLDLSTATYETPKVKWSARSDLFQIPEAPHITVTISPEEMKDVQSLYNVNQLTKIMSMIKLILVNYKDDKILQNLDDSYMNLPVQNKVSGAFSFAPPDGYLGSHVSWRYETFMDYLDTQVTYLLQILNDENMTVTIFGRSELIRKITPKEYNYTTPPNIGPVMLDYKKTIKTSDNRIYQFISSNKLRNDNNLIVILNPRNTNRVIYKIIDYQLYISNEIRDTVNYQLPAVTAFERWLFLQYQAVQGRILIVNPTGLKEDIENGMPMGQRALNDYTANKITKVVNGVAQIDQSQVLPGTNRAAMYPASGNPTNPSDTLSQTIPYSTTPPNYAVDDKG